MLPYLILGLFAGAIYALASVGVVLTYKTTGIFNFAFGGVAMFCAYVFWQFRDAWHLSQWFAIPLIVLVVAPAVGLLLEGVFRRVSAAPTEVQIVIALGLLSFFEALVPLVFGGSDRYLASVFGPSKFKLLGQIVTWNQAGTFLLALVFCAGLYLLLHYTRLGTSTRAVIDNRDLSGLMGVNANQVGQVAWVVSTVFAAVAGVLLSTQEGLVTYVLPALVIYAFAPAVFGKLRSLPLAFIGAVALAVIQNILARYNSSGFVANVESAIPYIALFVLLVVLGPRLVEIKAQVRPLVARRPPSSPKQWFALGGAGFVLAIAIGPHIFSSATLTDLAEAMAYAMVAVTLVALAGWTGQISIAQMSFAGIGAFTAAHIAGHDGGLFPLAVVLGVLIAVPIGLVVGLPSLRLSGLFLALATMAFAELMDSLVFGNTSISGGLTGLSLPLAKIGPLSFRSSESKYYLCLILLGLVAGGALWLRHGPVGRRLQMVRDAPEAAATSGASLAVTKLAVFAVCAGVASVAGALLAMTQQAVDPSSFSFNTSLELLILVVLGGRVLVSGALWAGALYLLTLLPLPNWFDKYFPLAIAVSVLAIANEPDGTTVYAARQASYCLAPLYRRPRPQLVSAVPDSSHG